ncbi:hypothetical protein MJO29_009891, partial [Puccinia striiformis f. sp. tritici]
LSILDDWLGAFYSRSIPTFICIDANLHHPHWNPVGVSTRDRQAQALLSTTGRFGFRLVSPKQVPTFFSRTGNGFTIDLTWANFLASKLVSFSTIAEDNHSSDHQAIELHLNIGKPHLKKRLVLPAWKDLDQADALTKITRPLSKLQSVTTGLLDNQVLNLTQVVTEAQDLLCKKISMNSSRSKSWWCNKTLDPIIDARKRARKWFLLTKSPVAAECYRQWAQFIWFTRKAPPPDTLQLGNQSLPPIGTVKWLGILLDSRLSYTETVAMLTKKIALTLAQFRPLGTSRWGLSSKDRVRLLSSVLLPRISYGSPVWATKINRCKVKSLSKKADKAAAVYSLGVFKTTSDQWLRDHSGVPPFFEEIIVTSFNFFCRKLINRSLNPSVQDLLFNRGISTNSWLAPHSPLSLPFLLQINLNRVESTFTQYGITSELHRLHRSYLNMSSPKVQAKSEVESIVSSLKSSESTLLIFTDGSFDEIKGGASAALCLERDLFLSSALGVSPNISNHECEAIGLLLAFKAINLSLATAPVSDVFIFTDNKGVLERTKNPESAHPSQYIFKEIMSLWLSLPTDIHIHFVWCPGHVGIRGNELADRLANQAVSRNLSPDRILPGNKSKIVKNLQLQIRSITKKGLANRLSSLPIFQSSILSQLNSGYSPLNYYLFKAKRRLDPICHFCSAKETTAHFFDLCPALKAIRRSLFSNLRRRKIKFSPNRPHLLLNVFITTLLNIIKKIISPTEPVLALLEFTPEQYLLRDVLTRQPIARMESLDLHITLSPDQQRNAHQHHAARWIESSAVLLLNDLLSNLSIEVPLLFNAPWRKELLVVIPFLQAKGEYSVAIAERSVDGAQRAEIDKMPMHNDDMSTYNMLPYQTRADRVAARLINI